MIRQFRKVPWLVAPIFAVVILSFVVFMGTGPTRSGNSGNYAVDTNEVSGEIYNQKVTQDQYNQSERDVDLFFFFNYGEWPMNNPNISQKTLMERIYINMMLLQKAKDLGVHVSEDQLEQYTASFLSSPELLRALGVQGQKSVPFNAFVEHVLAPVNLTAADFESYMRDQLAVEQLQQFYGLSGELVTPQDVTNEYIRQNQEYSAQIVFFSASNYLNRATVTPADVGQFYTNYMADYRLPQRVQVCYVGFSATNYLAEAQQTLKTNLDIMVNNYFSKYGMSVAPDAKTPDEAKAVLRKTLIQQQALEDAGQKAKDFAQAVFNVSNNANKPASAQDLYAVARQKGLLVQTPAPFSAEYGPEDFVAPPAFTKAAFELTPDSPISDPVASPDMVYVIALEKSLPSEIPPLDQIREQVTHDLKLRAATYMAIQSGTNFARSVISQMAIGKSFAAASVAAGAEPQMLPPFSLSTQELPELDGHATINQLRQAAFTTPVGLASGFMQTEDGGFVLYVESRLPVDESKMAADLPEFTARLREQRASAAFNEWVQREANRELRNTPLGKEMGAR